MAPVVMRGEVIEKSHIKCATNRAELLHQCVIETREVFVIEGLNDWVGDYDGARDDRIGGRRAALDQHFIKYAEVMFQKAIILFEMRQHMGVANLSKRKRKFFAL